MAFNAPVPLERHYDRSAFDYGSLALNDYLKKYVLQNQLKNAGRTYVTTTNTNTQVIAYYTLIAGDVHRVQVPGSISHGLGRHPIPVVVLARLAVDHNYTHHE